MITILTNLTIVLALAGLAATPAAVVFYRRWQHADQAARANGERGDLEKTRRELAEWELKLERAQLVALEARRQQEVARLIWLCWVAWQPADADLDMPSYRRGLIDAFESAQYTRPEAERALGA